MPTQTHLDLADFKFTASIDYLTLAGLARCELPTLQGKPKWPRQAPGRLTVQEPSAQDIQVLASAFSNASLYELEVCVDVRTAKPLSVEQQDVALQTFKSEFVAKRLKPTFNDGHHSGFRGAYDPCLKKTVPYNGRVPKADQQLLMGHRNDSVQVKCYFKRTDRRLALAPAQHSIRIEVRLGMVGLDHHGLLTLSDLQGFGFRKQLMPYFTHVYGTHHRKPRKQRSKALIGLMHAKLDDFDRPSWERIGVGAFLPGGHRKREGLVFERDVRLNGRIGQALGRLERAYTQKNSCVQSLPTEAQTQQPRGFQADELSHL